MHRFDYSEILGDLPQDIVRMLSEISRIRAMEGIRRKEYSKDYARMEVGHDKCKGLARVFSPLVASSDDMEAAMEWYFKYHHKKDRFFILIGEGEGGRLLKEYEQKDAEDLKKKGLVASYYTENHRKGFVTPEMVEEIKKTVARARFKRIWGKDMPEEMLSK